MEIARDIAARGPQKDAKREGGSGEGRTSVKFVEAPTNRSTEDGRGHRERDGGQVAEVGGQGMGSTVFR